MVVCKYCNLYRICSVLSCRITILICRPSEITVNIVKVRRKQHIHVQESGREEHAEENDECVRAESISTRPQSAP